MPQRPREMRTSRVRRTRFIAQAREGWQGARRSRRCTLGRSRGRRRRGGGFDIEGHFVETCTAHGIEGLDHVGMACVRITADVDGCVRVLAKAGREFTLQIGQAGELGIEINISRGADAEVDHIGLEIRLRGGGNRQIDLDGLLLGHRQADHHEGGEQEEHHVNERDDLQPRLLVRDGRVEFHGRCSVGR